MSKDKLENRKSKKKRKKNKYLQLKRKRKFLVKMKAVKLIMRKRLNKYLGWRLR
jgi:hypothetical protein